MTLVLLAAVVSLTNAFGTVRVDTLGAHVLSYVPAGGDEVLFLPSEDCRPPHWRHGGIPVCWPWFSRYGDPGSCMHGFVRLLDWEVVSRQDAAHESVLRLRLKSDEKSVRCFDGVFELNYEIVLSDCLRLDLKMRNTGPRRFAVTTGFHPYFQVKDLLSTTVRTPEETIRCVPEMDGGRPLADGRYVLGDGTREIVLTTRGNRKLVVWNPGEVPMDGLLPGEWRSFVCVEPVIVPRREGIWLNPGSEYALGLTIQASARGM